MKRFVSNSLFGALASLTATLGNLLSSLVVARVLGVDGSGSVAFIMWVVTATVTVCGLGIPATLARFLPALEGGGTGELGGAATRRLLIIYLSTTAVPLTAFAIIQVSLSGLVLGHGHGHGSKVYVYIAILCLLHAIGEFMRGYYRGHQDFVGLARLTTISAGCQFVCLILGAKLFGLPGALAAFAVGTAVMALPIWSVPLTSGPSLPRDLLFRLTRFAGFRWASDISSAFVWARIEVFFIQIAGGTTEVGLFTAGLTLVNLAIQGVQMLGWGLLPHFTEQFSQNALDGMRSGFATVVRLMALLTFPACLGLAALLPELIPLLFGGGFDEAVPSAIILLAGATMIGPGTVAMTIMWATERSDIDFLCGLAGALVAVLGGLILIPHLGLIGAAISRVATQLVFVCLCNLFLARTFHFRFPMSDLGRLMLAALACACVARLSLTFVWRGAGGLPFAIVAAVLTYGSALRLLRIVPSEDIGRLMRIIDMLPSPIAALSQQALRLISPAEAA